MQDAGDPCLPKTVPKNDTGTAPKEPDDVEMVGQESVIPAVTTEVVTSQASPLKRMSLPATRQWLISQTARPNVVPFMSLPMPNQEGRLAVTRTQKCLQ